MSNLPLSRLGRRVHVGQRKLVFISHGVKCKMLLSMSFRVRRGLGIKGRAGNMPGLRYRASLSLPVASQAIMGSRVLSLMMRQWTDTVRRERPALRSLWRTFKSG